MLEDFLRLHEDAADLTHVNILAELLMEGQKWAEAQKAILRAHQQAADQPLPIDLQVSQGAVLTWAAVWVHSCCIRCQLVRPCQIAGRHRIIPHSSCLQKACFVITCCA